MGHDDPFDIPVLDSGGSFWNDDPGSWVYPSLPYTQTVIFGHTPTYHYQDAFPLRIYHGIMNIGIDCGCAYEDYGRLACLRLDDMREFYSEDNDDGGQDNGE